MKTYEQIVDGDRWWYFYDRSIRLWTVFKVDENDYQIDTADHYHDRPQLLQQHPQFNFKKVIN